MELGSPHVCVFAQHGVVVWQKSLRPRPSAARPYIAAEVHQQGPPVVPRQPAGDCRCLVRTPALFWVFLREPSCLCGGTRTGSRLCRHAGPAIAGAIGRFANHPYCSPPPALDFRMDFRRDHPTRIRLEIETVSLRALTAGGSRRCKGQFNCRLCLNRLYSMFDGRTQFQEISSVHFSSRNWYVRTL